MDATHSSRPSSLLSKSCYGWLGAFVAVTALIATCCQTGTVVPSSSSASTTTTTASIARETQQLPRLMLEQSNVTQVVLGSPQDKLNYIRESLNGYVITKGHLNNIPTDANALIGLETNGTADPFVRAAAWVVNQDQINEQDTIMDRFALATIYYNNGGAAWTNNTNWMTTASHCEWYGVFCCIANSPYAYTPACGMADRETTVIEVDLYNNGVSGTISDVWVVLHGLRSISLHKNAVTGPMNGPALSALPNLLKLYLQYNQLNGTVPSTMRKNKKLDTLYVQGNDLSGTWPKELCPQCPSCPGVVEYFGLDCEKVECSAQCCRFWTDCFYETKFQSEIN